MASYALMQMAKWGGLNKRYVDELGASALPLKGPTPPYNFSEIQKPLFYHVKLKLGRPTRIGPMHLAREDQSPCEEKKPKQAKPLVT